MLTNSERRLALAEARQHAIDFGRIAQRYYEQADSEMTHEAVQMGTMWANVAQALKVGPAAADGVADSVSDPDTFGRPATTTRARHYPDSGSADEIRVHP